MKTSPYSVTVPVLIQFLSTIPGMLDKTATFAEEKKCPIDYFLNARLYPDQFSFTKQIQITCDNAKGIGTRLTGMEAPKFEDSEKTVEELKMRVQKTTDFLKTLKPEHFAEAETRRVELSYKSFKNMSFEGFDYMLEYGLPNFFFHLVTAYDILRHNGVPVGKGDFITKMSLKDND